MATYFTDEQINEILNIFNQNLGHRQYIGARYVPTFGRVGETSIDWDNSAPYEPLTIVLYQGNSFTSRQYVPAGIDIDNTEFWAETGNFNAQVEQYRQEVLDLGVRVDAYDGRITANEDDIADLKVKSEYFNKDLATFYKTVTKLNTLTMPDSRAIIQGLAVANDKMYFVASDNNRNVSIVGVLNDALTAIDSYADLEGNYHFNSLCYDAIEGKLIAMSAANKLAIIEPATLESVIKDYEAPSTDYQHHNLAVISSDNLAISALAGSNKVIIYLRKNNVLVPAGHFSLPMRGTTPVQDMHIEEHNYYQMLGYHEEGANILVMRTNGFPFFKICITNMENNNEGEAITYFNNSFYITDEENNLYTIDDFTFKNYTSIRGIPTYTPYIGVNPRYILDNLSNSNLAPFNIVEGTYNNVANYVITKIPLPDSFYPVQTEGEMLYGLFNGQYITNYGSRFAPDMNIRIREPLIPGYLLQMEYNLVQAEHCYRLQYIRVVNLSDTSLIASMPTTIGKDNETIRSDFETFLTALKSVTPALTAPTGILFGISSIGKTPFASNNPHLINIGFSG